MFFSDLFKEFQAIQVNEDIILRQTIPERDAKSFWEIYSDEENFKYFSFYKKPKAWSEARERRAQESRIKNWKGKREYTWVVTYREEVIGQIQLFNFSNRNENAEVGYFIKRDYWNRGINTKALKAVCRFGFEQMGFVRIEALVHVDNIGSNRTLIKAGFTKEGMLRRRFYLNGRGEDCNIYSILREDMGF